MRIDVKTMLAGQPILQIRMVLRRARDTGHCTQYLVEEVLNADQVTAAAVLRSLIDDGYLERDDGDRSSSQWRTAVKGNALAQASAASPMARATADCAVSALLRRVRQVNADEDVAYVVERMILFASYLGDAPTVNDVDVAVQL